jgi:hypothetical protein
MMNMINTIILNPQDNVAVFTKDVLAGQEVQGLGFALLANKDFSLGDKIALTSLDTDALVYKYGLVIGKTVQPIGQGDWVHLHNIKSQYVPTYVFNGSDQQEG